MEIKNPGNIIIDEYIGISIEEFDVTVPIDYNSDTYIDRRGTELKNLKSTYLYDDNLISKNCSKATTKLEPGKTYRAKIYPVKKIVSLKHCIKFLKEQNGLLVGPHGLLLAQSQHGNKFPKYKWTISFDEKATLQKNLVGYHESLSVRNHDGFFTFNFSYCKGLCCDYFLLCFYDIT